MAETKARKPRTVRPKAEDVAVETSEETANSDVQTEAVEEPLESEDTKTETKGSEEEVAAEEDIKETGTEEAEKDQPEVEPEVEPEAQPAEESSDTEKEVSEEESEDAFEDTGDSEADSEEDEDIVLSETESEENAPEQRDRDEIAKEEENELQEAVHKAEEAAKSHKKHMDLYERKLETASRSAKRSLYEDSDVIPLKDKVSFSSDGDRKRQDMLELIDSQKSKKVLTGTVVAMVMTGKIPCAMVKFGEFYRVIIPYDWFVIEREYDKKILAEMMPSDQLSQKRFMINQRIFSEVDFIVHSIDEENEVIVGNRVQAMQKKMRNWYLGRSPKTKEYLLEAGKCVEARVVFSTSDYVTIEVFGKEARLTAEDLSWRFIPDISAEFKVGSTVPVLITALEREKVDKKTYNIRAKYSVKLARPDNRLVYFNKYPVNAMVSGIVVGVNEYGIFTRIEDINGGMDILCQFSDYEDEIPPVNTKVLVQIMQKNEERMRIFGRIVKKLG